MLPNPINCDEVYEMNKMVKLLGLSMAGLSLMMAANLTLANPAVGETAPDFELVDTNGANVALSSLKGKTVVLEWTNHQCPYVKKHYSSGNMQALQKEAVADDVVWVSVISSGEGKQGYVSDEQANSLSTERDASPTHVLLDSSGDIGKLYRAKTTPHMFIINPEGNVAYMGGIDDIPSADSADIEDANNYVRVALGEMKEGQPISTATSRPYGCSIKYKS